jgi:long-subunit acyl-CoA synthetase (AMP-forming)
MERLIDDNEQEVRAYDTRGEIWIRGPTVIRTYFNNPQADESSFTGDWFHTGDVAYCDGITKKWYIVDRKKVNRLPHRSRWLLHRRADISVRS